MADVTKLRDGSLLPDFALGSVARKYFLLFEEYSLEIPKPEGWTGLGRKFVRDKKYHGFLFEGGEDTVVKFHKEEGGEYLSTLYYTYGQDIQVTIQEQATSNNVTITEWEGVLNLATFKRLTSNDSNYVEVTVQRKGIESLVKPRWDTNISMNDSLTIDGTAITPPPKRIINLHSKAITTEYLTEKLELQIRVNQGITSRSSSYYLQMDTRDPVKKDIEDFSQSDIGVGVEVPAPLITAKYEGTYDFNLTVEGEFDITLERRILTTPIDIGNWTLKWILRINSLEFEFTNPISDFDGHPSIGATPFNMTYTGTHFVPMGGVVYIFGKFEFEPSRDNWKGSSWSLKSYKTIYDISATTTFSNTQTYCYKVKECLSHVLSGISDNDALITSNYYDACGGDLTILNGFFLRYANITSFPNELIYPVLNFKTLVSSLQAIHGVGMGYERDVDGNDIVRIEPYDYFYKDVEIMDITDYLLPLTYQEEVASDLIFSEINVGYNKYPKEDAYGLDEFNTEFTAQSPIKYHSNKFEQKSSIIASGYLIEKVRRESLSEEDARRSTDYDDDNFFISLNPNPSSPTISNVSAYFREPYMFQSSGNAGEDVGIDPLNCFLTTIGIQLYAGASIVISGSTYNNGTFKIISVIDVSGFSGFTNYAVYVEENIVYEYGAIITINFSVIPLVAEKDEKFTITTGSLFAPETSYNIRLNPKYMLLQHSKLLNSGFYYKSSGDKIKTKKFTQNGGFSVQRKLSETCINNDPNRELYKMDGDVVLSNFNNRESFFTPEYIKVQAIMQPEQVKYIINAHRNLNTAGKNYGYLKFTNPYNEVLECYLNELNILENGIENKVEFVLIKKKT